MDNLRWVTDNQCNNSKSVHTATVEDLINGATQCLNPILNRVTISFLAIYVNKIFQYNYGIIIVNNASLIYAKVVELQE